MHIWNQDLTNTHNDGKFHFTKNFRGSVGTDWKDIDRLFDYEFVIKPSFRLSMENRGYATSVIFGLFFFTLYLTVHKKVYRIPNFLVPIGRSSGFYWIENYLRIFINEKRDMSGDNSGVVFHIEPAKILFGKQLYFTKELLSSFSPKQFKFRGKIYTMDEIKIMESFWFRSRIPFGLFKVRRESLKLKINKPPMRQGKGTTSYNCDDDGTYGLSTPYKGPKPTWKNRDKIFNYACKYYCESVSKSISRYGRSGDDRDLASDIVNYEYVGTQKSNNTQSSTNQH